MIKIKPIQSISKKPKEKKKSASKTKDGLTLKNEEFCKLFVGNDKNLFGNGTQCYLEVYGMKDDKTKKKISYQTANANATRLLVNDSIVRRINDLLETGGFNDQNVDKQHEFLINQHADKKTKLGAIKEYNTLKKRVTKDTDSLKTIADLMAENYLKRNKHKEE